MEGDGMKLSADELWIAWCNADDPCPQDANIYTDKAEAEAEALERSAMMGRVYQAMSLSDAIREYGNEECRQGMMDE